MLFLRRILLLFSIVLVHAFCYGQSVPRIRLTGTVVDESTGEPLHFANVFLSNTTKGAATDEEGSFTIVNVPLGTYELVASMVGYEMEVKNIRLQESSEYTFSFELTPKVLETPALEVTAAQPKKWKENLTKFQTMLLGTTKNAEKCTVLNPEILDFRKNEASGEFIATADGPLEIENRALGYHVSFYLEELTLQNDALLRTRGNTVFKPLMAEDEKEEKGWNKNRIKTYNGSLRHFLIALVSDRLKEEGFYIRNDYRRYRLDKDIFLNNVTTKDLLLQCPRSFEKEFDFKDFLRVIYAKGEFPRENRWGRKYFEKTSWLKLNTQNAVIINELGLLYHPDAVLQYGYWAEQRLADELPWDYLPSTE